MKLVLYIDCEVGWGELVLEDHPWERLPVVGEAIQPAPGTELFTVQSVHHFWEEVRILLGAPYSRKQDYERIGFVFD